jgi:bacterioferritin-associated ferredoxin
MYACVCKAVTESAVQACHNAGLRDVRQVSAATRAGTGCGQCVNRLRSMLSTARETESVMADSAA